MDNMDERRLDPRIRNTAPVRISVLVAREAPALEGMVFERATRDISAAGLRFTVPCSIPLGAILRLKVDISEPDESYNHVGQVAWCESTDEEEDEAHMLGVQILQTLGNRALDWRAMVRSLIRDDAG